jgi:hypothetical protein
MTTPAAADEAAEVFGPHLIRLANLARKDTAVTVLFAQPTPPEPRSSGAPVSTIAPTDAVASTEHDGDTVIWHGTDDRWYDARRAGPDTWDVSAATNLADVEPVGTVTFSELLDLLRPRPSVGVRAYAENANGRFEQRTAVIVRQLRGLADEVAAIAAGDLPSDRGAVPPRSARAQAIVHRVTWKLANLDLGDLTAVAAEADLLAERLKGG